MKTIPLFLILLLCIAFSLDSDKDFVQETVGITKGRTLNCLGDGLCGIAQRSAIEGDYDLLGKLTRNEEGQIVLKINKSSTSVKQIERLFENKRLHLSKNIALSSTILSKIGLQEGKQLKKGNYSVQETSEEFIITF